MPAKDSKFSQFNDGGTLAINDGVVGLRDDINTRFTYVGVNGLYLPLVGGIMEGTINMNNNSVSNIATPVGDNDGASMDYIDTLIVATLLNYLLLSGGTMSGDISMDNTYTFNDVPDPVADTDAANKQFVDTVLSDFNSTQNIILGGNFDTNPWQDGISFPAVATNVYTADQWVHTKSGAGAINVSRTQNAPTAAQAGIYSRNSLLAKVSTTDVSIGATDTYSINTYIEGYNWVQTAGIPFTLSFWVKSGVTGTYCVGLSNAAQDESWVSEYTVNVADTWEYKELYIDACPLNGTWTFDNTLSLKIFFVLAAGSNFITPAVNTWQNGNYSITANQVNWMDDVANIWQIQLVDLHPGHYTRIFPFRNFNEELLDFYRYYYRRDAAAASETWFNTVNTTGSAARGIYPLPVAMRTKPTLSTSTVTNYEVEYLSSSVTASSILISYGVTGTNKEVGIGINVSAAVLTVGQGSAFRAVNTNAYLIFNARM